MDLTYPYAVKRSNMGRQPMFSAQGPELCDSVVTNMAQAKHYILRNPVHETTQNTPNFGHCYVNSGRTDFTNTGSNHAEGGWPKDVSSNDPEATQRYRRKLEKDDNYLQCVSNLCPGVERYVLQNNAIDMYQTYYSELKQLPQQEPSDCRIVNNFRDDPVGGHIRRVSSISWQPDGGYQFAVTYVDVDFNRNTQSSVNAYIWDVEYANNPETTITPPCPMLDLQFNPKEVNFLVGGLVNGQVGAWDRRSPHSSAVMCALHMAHRDVVRNVLFNNSKSGKEFFSAGADGVLKWWDIRNMEEPTDELILDMVTSPTVQQSMGNAKGASVLEFENTLPTRFMVGTEDGSVIIGNRKGKTAMEKLPGKFDAHLGPVWALQRNPSFLKYFLTVGDWTARVWNEDCRESPIIWTAPDRHRITDGTWSPTRISLMMMTKWNGVLSIWDLVKRQHEPVFNMQVCEEPLFTVRTHEAGALLACGSGTGNVYMLKLSRNFIQSDKNDKVQLTSIFERESKRERILEALRREIRLKQREVEEGSPAAAASLADVDAAMDDSDLQYAAAEYLAMIKKEHFI